MKRPTLARQRGITMLMVLLLMSAMLLGALALARITEAGMLISGNVATKDASTHAAEVGRNVAYAQVQALATKNSNTGGWYWATMQPTDAATGVPSTIDFDATPVVAGGVGRFKVTYAVERMCTVGTVTMSSVQCLVMTDPNLPENKGYGAPAYMAKGARQYRITVRVIDDRGTQTWTQSLVTAG